MCKSEVVAICVAAAALTLTVEPAHADSERARCGTAIANAERLQGYAIGARYALISVALLAEIHAREIDAEIPNASGEHAEALRQRAFALRTFGRSYQIYDKLTADELMAQLVQICADHPDEPFEGTLARQLGERHR